MGFRIRDLGFGGPAAARPALRRGMGWGLAIACAAMVSACAPAPATQNTPAAGSSMPRTIVDPYLKIQAALADDSIDGIHTSAAAIVTAATSLGAPAMKIDGAALQLAATSEAAPPDIAAVREKFGALSEAIDTYMTGLHLTPPDGVKVATCPMANKPWMQTAANIENPYYGKEMPTCGSFR
jgi:hypothetical protein